MRPFIHIGYVYQTTWRNDIECTLCGGWRWRHGLWPHQIFFWAYRVSRIRRCANGLAAFYEIARCKRNYKTFSKYFSKPFVTSSLLWCLRCFWSTFLCPIMLAIAVVEADLFGTKKSLDADILPLEEASLLPYFHNSLL